MQSHFFAVGITLLLTSLGLNVLADPDGNLVNSTLGQRTFSVNLFKAIAKSGQDNFAVSTTDAFLGLLRLYFGSENPSKRNLEYSLGINNTEGYLNSSRKYKSMVDRLQLENSFHLTFSNGMFHRDTYTLKNNYTKTIRKVYDSLAENIRFADFDDLLESLKNWYLSLFVAPDFQRSEFTGDENIILFGGGFFLHQWQQADRCVYKSNYFPDALTSESDVTYTHMLGNFNYGELPDLSASYIAIPWDQYTRDIILYLILPNAKDGLSTLENGITHGTIEKMVSEAKEREVRVSVPDISIRSKLHLQSILADKLSMNNVFHEGNFSSLAMPDPKIVNKVLNAVTIQAFAGDGSNCPANVPPTDEMHSDRPYFNADHPFLIAIVSKGTHVEGKESLLLGMARHKLPKKTPKATVT